ncbi:MAG TPA: lipopolysaccharide kinase InaA family protein, partial [Gemmataceae bacterium]|nr:lipopolysaccharide kinase InaA family protein [Gemmataceae bacterium]
MATAIIAPSAKRKNEQHNGWMRVNSAYSHLLQTNGFTKPQDFFDAPGPIISGHPDRHVLRMTIGYDLCCFLKREHRVPWKYRWRSFRAGFGFISLSQREEMMLQVLQQAGVGAPEWLAVGEDGQGRAFLLLKEIEGSIDLRRFLRQSSAEEKCEAAGRLGEFVADLHRKGIEHPDLYAKHILIHPRTKQFTLIDWQRSRLPHRLSFSDRCRDLAALNASLAEDLATEEIRREFLRAYCGCARAVMPPPAYFCREVQRRTARLLERTSIREQRLPTWNESQPLFWLDGEALCVTPRGQELWHADALAALGYGAESGRSPGYEAMSLHLPDNAVGELVRRRTWRLLGRSRDWLRQKRWTSPEVRQAGHLLRLERVGERGPSLLAFGQRCGPFGVVESFLLTEKEMKDQSRAR